MAHFDDQRRGTPYTSGSGSQMAQPPRPCDALLHMHPDSAYVLTFDQAGAPRELFYHGRGQDARRFVHDAFMGARTPVPDVPAPPVAGASLHVSHNNHLGLNLFGAHAVPEIHPEPQTPLSVQTPESPPPLPVRPFRALPPQVAASEGPLSSFALVDDRPPEYTRHDARLSTPYPNQADLNMSRTADTTPAPLGSTLAESSAQAAQGTLVAERSDVVDVHGTWASVRNGRSYAVDDHDAPVGQREGAEPIASGGDAAEHTPQEDTAHLSQDDGASVLGDQEFAALDGDEGDEETETGALPAALEAEQSEPAPALQTAVASEAQGDGAPDNHEADVLVIDNGADVVGAAAPAELAGHAPPPPSAGAVAPVTDAPAVALRNESEILSSRRQERELAESAHGPRTEAGRVSLNTLLARFELPEGERYPVDSALSFAVEHIQVLEDRLQALTTAPASNGEDVFGAALNATSNRNSRAHPLLQKVQRTWKGLTGGRRSSPGHKRAAKAA